MARDGRIEAIFTTADDQMQGLWALHRYLKAATDLTRPETLAPYFPPRAFRLTHTWSRNYNPLELTQAISDTGIDFLLSRSSLVALVTICEAALAHFSAHLAKLGHCSEKANQKQRLVWAFEMLKTSTSGSAEMLARLPETCGDVDNARRLRNRIIHNNGCYDHRYLSDAIDDGWVKPQYEKDSSRAVNARSPIFLLTERYEHFSRSHIEFLHILHNTIQQQCFGHADGYNYANESKRIEWSRILSGRRDVGM